jgi:hypothetical protein
VDRIALNEPNMTITSPCIVDDMPMEIYHGDPCPAPALSNSIIKPLLAQSPYHAWLQHPRLNPNCTGDEDSKFDLGTAAHALLLEGADRCRVIEADDYKTKAAREARDLARVDGFTPLLRAQYDAAKVMATRAREYLDRTEFAGILSRGKPEVSLFWNDMGVWVKGRADFLTDDRRVILDYKSTGLPPSKWQRAMLDHGYDTQSLLYQRGMSVLGHTGVRFAFLVQEVCQPHACWLVEASESMRELANMKIARATRLWAECLKRNYWPSYPTTVQPAHAPNWALIEEESIE